MLEIMTELKKRGRFVVIGGPWTSVKEVYCGSPAGPIFLGEVEDTCPCERVRYEFTLQHHSHRT